MSQCIDPVVGKILAGWRYDISGLAPEMRGDYEQHFSDCERCRSRQTIHRAIDISLIALASISAVVFLLAFVQLVAVVFANDGHLKGCLSYTSFYACQKKCEGHVDFVCKPFGVFHHDYRCVCIDNRKK